MHFAAQNLLYTIHQALDTQFVTVAGFKRYTRTPENRTFKNYFRRTGPGSIFIPYLRKRPRFSLSRYIALHRRKGNRILHSFNRIKTAVFSNLQWLRPAAPASLKSQIEHLNPLKTQNKANCAPAKDNITPYILRTKAPHGNPARGKNKPNRTKKLLPCQGEVAARPEGFEAESISCFQAGSKPAHFGNTITPKNLVFSTKNKK